MSDNILTFSCMMWYYVRVIIVTLSERGVPMEKKDKTKDNVDNKNKRKKKGIVYKIISAMLADSTAQRIRKMIEDEERFSAGDKLPNENDLASELGVSRSTLREAVKILTTSGMLEIRRGKGTFVTSNTVISSGDLSDIAS